MGGCCYREHEEIPPTAAANPVDSIESNQTEPQPASQPKQKLKRAVKTAMAANHLRRATADTAPKVIEPESRPKSAQLNLQAKASSAVKKLSEPFDTNYRRSKGHIVQTTAYQIYSAEYLPTGQKCIVKQLNKKGTVKDMQANRANAIEAEAWVDISHPCLLSMLEVVQDENYFYVVSETCSSGTLVGEMRKAATESWAASVLLQVLSALRTVHTAQRLLLTVAPDTVFIIESQGKPEVKIVNPLDLSGHVEGKDFSQSKAPEEEKDEKSDVWSCGIVLFFLLSCELPYSPEAYRQLLTTEHKPHIAFSYFWKKISPEAKSLVTHMLSVDPASRFSIQDCLSDPWIASNQPSIPNKVLNQTMKQLRSSTKVSPVKAAIVNFLVTRVMKGTELANYAEVFMSLDTDGNGTLTPEELRIGLERLMSPAAAAAEVKKITASQPGASKTISYNQYLQSVVDQKVLLSQENLHKVFDYFDSDHSNMITPSELKAKLFGNSTQSEAMWKELSRSRALRDEVITFREFEEMIKGVC